ncbi:DNA-3-methyladenine glycosylase 2 family protein [Pseudooceanicola sp. 216_PA32_1]|uniref:DNA-3-methyladenine glycosylase II n=1 Tax=Pseudooceanicola pacificus TaxID=2676438 RepID=A0A844WDI8_9RHOB|nr:DNA-3-methyladenine glycosylase 2 family protein [Pseudooceanicola pacificus]MWB79583.1 DNA-3-methyladenine glycosylase 2 family protein [Pseudooceanicola pacificus]
MTGRIIATMDCVAEGASWLAEHDPRMAHALDRCGLPPLRRRPDGFATLLQAVVGQQVSTASAAAIWARMESAGLTSAPAIAAATEGDLKAVGLSRPKMKYARGLAASGLDFAALRGMPDAEVLARLVALPGIGPWTAEIYALTALGRADVFPPGDLALQEAARILYALPGRPAPAEFRVMAERWSPWRAVAARMLWAFYRAEKTREGIA